MKLLIKLFCFLICFQNIKSECLIKYKGNHRIVPKFEKSIGKFKIKVPFRRDETSNILRLSNGDSVNGFCETQFSPIFYKVVKDMYEYDGLYRQYIKKVSGDTILNQTSIILNCRDGKILFNQRELNDQTFLCDEPKCSIYSTKKPYSWCQKNKNSSTFLFATQNMNNKSHILAAFCFNVDQLLLQTLVYNKTYFHNFYFEKLANVSNEILDEDLWNFKTAIVSELNSENFIEKFNTISKIDEWLNVANYEISTIIQDVLLMKYLEGYESIFNIIWWSPLRLGNWKRFQTTLNNYAQNSSYEVYVGTSGVVQYPSDDKCQKEKYLEIKFDSRNETVPAYIWTYLRSNDALNKDFVLVGYNSPFAEYFSTEKIIFCPDICSEIPWLKEISPTFRYKYAGIIFCCSTNFIRQTQYLQGFPMDALRPTAIVTTTVETEILADITTETSDVLINFLLRNL